MTTQTLPRIGFIGLGLMGSAMVEHLMDQGYPLTVLGRKNRQPIDAAVQRGAIEATSAKALAESVDIVMVCVDTSAAVESVMYGPQGVIAGAAAGLVVIDFGTSVPDSTKRIGAELRAKGADYLDSAIGRTPAHARQGSLNLMVGGADATVQQVRPVLEVIGENVFHLGELGAGHTVKLINNFFGMTLATAMSEAFAVADVAGVDRGNLYNIMSSGPLHSPMMDFVKANAVDGDAHKLGFSIANARKDLGYYTDMVNGHDVPSFIGPATRHALTFAVAQGFGNRDVPVMVDFFQQSFKPTGR